MRNWLATGAQHMAPDTTVALIESVGTRGFAGAVLGTLQSLIPAASWNAYQVGGEPRMYFSASHEVPDRTTHCWQAYLAGPHARDRTLQWDGADAGRAHLCHITSGEVPDDHRQRVYDAHGVAERISIVRQQAGGQIFAVNLYRHRHQPAFSDRHLAAFETVGPVLLALAHKHVELAPPARSPRDWLAHWRSRLQLDAANLTERELDVCARILAGWSLDGVAVDLGVSLTTVKTYRKRAFDRMGIHFRNELFSRVGTAGAPAA